MKNNLPPSFHEDQISQIPAIQVLQNLGYTYLTPEETLDLRGGKASEVLLDGILEQQLREMNKINFKGEEVPFTEGNIHSAIQALKDVIYDGLVRTNEKVYDLLCLGKSLQQSIKGDIKSFTLQYIDWEEPKNNVYHVTAEFEVEKTGSHDRSRPDIVLFINGIPLVVIECKRPDMKAPIDQAISQQIRNQKDDEIPKLFLYSQLLLVLSKNEAKYATTGTPIKFWAVWKEKLDDTMLASLVNQPLSDQQKDRLFSGPFSEARADFDLLEASGDREVTEQDSALFSLCHPERLNELIFRFIIFDAGDKKVSRYQQFFCVKEILERIKRRDNDGRRQGGVVWHTQGSGKSLTMVMLAKAIALAPNITEHKIILVSDRVDLDDQIYRTFHHCGRDVEQARTGKHLLQILQGKKQRIITTVIDKFEAAVGRTDIRNTDTDIFVLVDEGHRGQYGPRHAKMRKVMPNACYIGFTGTPVMKKDKNTVEKFGGIIDTYTIDKAVKDKAVVPLLYEGRNVEQKVDRASIDSWFDKITGLLTDDQVVDLKKKFATTDQLNKAEQKIARVAWDLSEHFRDTWQGTPFKAQLVTQDKATALLYKKYIDEFGMVSAEILISGPDDREGETDIYKDNKQAIQSFWKGMMDKYGSDREYNKQLINSFKFADEPEIIIVVDKLLTGFDAPRNTVLYLTKKLKEHTLLQAIARVNRLYEGKDFGYIIDYRGVLQNLDQALNLYADLPDFEAKDLEGTLTHVKQVVATLPQKHSVLWEIFKEIKNKHDEEAYEIFLADDALRTRFYDRLSDYSKVLAVAMASVQFIEETSEEKINEYKRDLKVFSNLRTAVRRRYAETVDFSDYEPKIQKLIDTHVGTGEVEVITPLVNIFDQESFNKEIEKLSSTAAKADTIAHRTKKTITEKMQEDPAFYKKFSEMLEAAIRAFREERIKAAEYLKKVSDIMNSVVNRTGDEIPDKLKHHEVAKAFYGSIKHILEKYDSEGNNLEDAEVQASLSMEAIINKHRIVNWTTDPDVQNRMRNAMEDYLFDLKDETGIDLSFDDIDIIMDLCLDIAKVRCP